MNKHSYTNQAVKKQKAQKNTSKENTSSQMANGIQAVSSPNGMYHMPIIWYLIKANHS
jgi:hypothetical protein